MAKRLNLNHDEETRRKIKTSQLLNRLTDNAFGKINLENSQVKSIEILLRKSLPDLSSIQISGDKDNPLSFTIMTGVPRDTSR